MKKPASSLLQVRTNKQNADKLLDKKTQKSSIPKTYNINRGTLASYINAQILEELTP